MTNLYHVRLRFEEKVTKLIDAEAGAKVRKIIEANATCYAAKLHLNRGSDVTKPSRSPKKGYAPTFEKVSRFPGRMAKIAQTRASLVEHRRDSPWKLGLPRMIFVSDMGTPSPREKTSITSLARYRTRS